MGALGAELTVITSDVPPDFHNDNGDGKPIPLSSDVVVGADTVISGETKQRQEIEE